MRPRVGAAIAAALAVVLVLTMCTVPEPEGGAETPGLTASVPTKTTVPRPTPSPTPSPTPTPIPTLAWGPSVEDLELAIQEASGRDLADVAGLVVVARYGGTSPENAAKLVRTHKLGGLVHFTPNVTNPQKMADFALVMQAEQEKLGRDWPFIISTDQEGGRVQRLKAPWPVLPAFMAYGAANNSTQRPAAAAQATDLRASGVNMNFAPVADVTIGRQDPAIGVRAAGQDPEVVSQSVLASVQGHEDVGVIPVIKHFPGHGSVTEDSHFALPVQNADYADLYNRDWQPFRQAIDAGAPAIMMGHINVTSIDTGIPSSLSPKIYAILRDDLKFTGVIITDALDMAGVTKGRTPEEIAVGALNAGADVLLTPTNIKRTISGITAAVKDGSLSRARLDEAAGRVIALMRWQDALAQQAGPVEVKDVGRDAKARADLAAAAITQIAGTCHSHGILDGTPIQSVNLLGGTTTDRQEFTAAAKRAGLTVTDSAPVSLRLLSSNASGKKADVIVAVEAPYGLGKTPGRVKLALFGRTPESFDALVAVLQARAGAPGTAPVNLGDVSAGTRLCSASG